MESQYVVLKKIERLADFIQKRLDGINISWDRDWRYIPDAAEKLRILAAGNPGFVADSLEMGITDSEDTEQVVFAKYSDNLDELRGKVMRKITSLATETAASNACICFVSADMRQQVALKNHFKTNGIIQAVRSCNRRNQRKPFNINWVDILLRDSKEKSVELNSASRHEFLLEPPVNMGIFEERESGDSGNIQAMVCVVHLYQLAQIYNDVGDQLFHKNVRFGIGENMGVEQAIRRTLEKEPAYFFFKNSGIAILANQPKVYSLYPERITLGNINEDAALDFSVVNGAQTISTAAKWFFQMEVEKAQNRLDKDRLRIYESAKENARVLVRIIKITEVPQKTGPSIESQISVALNRQKPINAEDIAFTSSVVQKLERYLTRNTLFRLVRAGEETAAAEEMHLSDFVRARAAGAGKPGTAWSGGGSQLIKAQDPMEESQRFKDTTIFPKDWIDAETDEEMTASFGRNYQAIWFIHYLSTQYSNFRKKISDTDADTQIVMNNGKWYFTAAVTQIFNHFHVTEDMGEPDYSEFAFASINMTTLRGNLSKAIQMFARLITETARRRGEKIAANTFKKDFLYQEVLKVIQGTSPDHDSDLLEYMAGELKRVLLKGQDIFTASWTAKGGTGKSALAGKNFVVLDGETIPVKSGAKAMGEIAVYVLSHTAKPLDKILPQCERWILKKKESDEPTTGNFHSKHQIQVGSETYWVGTNMKTTDKSKEIETLCLAAGIDRARVEWYSWEKTSNTHKKCF